MIIAAYILAAALLLAQVVILREMRQAQRAVYHCISALDVQIEAESERQAEDATRRAKREAEEIERREQRLSMDVDTLSRRVAAAVMQRAEEADRIRAAQVAQQAIG